MSVFNGLVQNGGYFSFGHSPNITGNAQVRLLLACQPCNHYLLLVNEFQPKPSSERKVAFAEYFTRQMTKGACVHIDFFVFGDRVSYLKT